jgi:hypothetical protein
VHKIFRRAQFLPQKLAVNHSEAVASRRRNVAVLSCHLSDLHTTCKSKRTDRWRAECARRRRCKDAPTLQFYGTLHSGRAPKAGSAEQSAPSAFFLCDQPRLAATLRNISSTPAPVFSAALSLRTPNDKALSLMAFACLPAAKAARPSSELKRCSSKKNRS